MSIETIIGLVLYIVPGFLALELYHYVYPIKDRDNFIISTWSIIFGVLITGFLKWFDYCYLNNALRSNDNTFPSFLFIIVLIVSGLLIGALGIACHILREKLSKRFFFLEIPSQSLWKKIINNSNEDWVVVFLDDESIYLGWIQEFTANPNNENQEFLLNNAARVDENLEVVYEVTGIGVYLNTKNVKRIEFIRNKD